MSDKRITKKEVEEALRNAEEGSSEEELQKVRKLAQEGKIQWPENQRIDNFDEQIDRLLKIIAEITESPGMEDAFVSDKSMLGDFFFDYSNDEFTEYVSEISKKLGIEINGGDEYLIDIAIRMVANDTG